MSDDVSPKCATCGNDINWKDAYLCQDTPGPGVPRGQGSWGPRVYCPHCGSLIASMDRPWIKEEWDWYGDNAKINEGCPPPPSPWMYMYKGIPQQLKPLFSENKLDIDKMKLYLKKSEGKPELAGAAKEQYEKVRKLVENDKPEKALEALEVFSSLGSFDNEHAYALAQIGGNYLEKKRVDEAFECCLKSVEIDPSASWHAHSVLSMIYNTQGEYAKAEHERDEARRLAGTVWWEPEAVKNLNRIIRDWDIKKAVMEASNKPVIPPPPIPEEKEVTTAPIQPVVSTPSSPEQVRDKITADRKFCVDCGSEIHARAEICPNCGIPRARVAKEEEKRNDIWEQPKESFWHGAKYIIGGYILTIIFPLKQLGYLAVTLGVICIFLLAPYQLFVAWKEKKNEGKPKSPSLWQRYLDWVDRMINR